MITRTVYRRRAIFALTGRRLGEYFARSYGEHFMEEYKCAFNATLLSDHFACPQGERVARRAGPDTACRAHASHERCAALFARLRQAAVPAFGCEDDLLSMPHSVLVKIQFGGLAGLQRLVTGADESVVTDIDGLVARAAAKFGAIESVPCDELVEDMTTYLLRRRR